MNPSPKNILVFRIGFIGDTVAALPSLWVLRRQFADARIAVLSQIPAKKTQLPPETVLPQNGLVDDFLKYPGGASMKNLIVSWRQIRQLRTEGYETIVYLTPTARTKKQRRRDQLFFRLCGLKHFLATKGFADNLVPRLSDGRLAVKANEADALLERLRLDGLPVPASGEGCMDLRITEAERQRAKDWWQKKTNVRPGSNGWVAICTGAKLTSKIWPWERYAEVVRLLIDKQGLFPVIIGGREDQEVGEKLVSGWGTGLCAAGELSVRESAALMEGARFYLGNDTGVMHLAAAVGKPCVAIFSARDWPGIWEPYGKGHKVLRFDVPCAGCHLAVCDKDLQCLRGIEVQQVYDACVAVIQAKESYLGLLDLPNGI
jgi:ADP-heptose:LPS heptosyltransferase